MVNDVVRETRTIIPLAGAVDRVMVLEDAKVNEVDTPLTKTETSACAVYAKGIEKVVVLPFAVYSI